MDIDAHALRSEGGPMYIGKTIAIPDSLDVNGETGRKLYRDNAARLLGLKLA